MYKYPKNISKLQNVLTVPLRKKGSLSKPKVNFAPRFRNVLYVSNLTCGDNGHIHV